MVLVAILKINNSQDWAKAQIIGLKSSNDNSLKSLTDKEPFFVMKKTKNIFFSLCTTLVFLRSSQQSQPIKLRLIFLPNIFVIALLIFWLITIWKGLEAYWMSVELHQLDEKLPVTPFLLAYQWPSLFVFAILIIWPIYSEKPQVIRELKALLSSPE